ncbi:methionyl-tRNA formyltransferase [Patescibacteria group bacterium]|nr:methionyl-tRNA formyltransferase [Patescibacteria group bacterium]
MENSKLKFAFWGTPDVASETLEILKQAGYLPAIVITTEDKPKGRGLALAPSPVKVWAQENNIPVYHDYKNLPQLDLSIVVAFGQILNEETLNAPRLGSINIHYSLLPKYRGASPVESAILNGETETGVTIQKMELKMDAGAIMAQEKLEIMPDEKAYELRARLIKQGGALLVKTLPNLENITPVPQDEARVTKCGKIKKEDGEISLDDDAHKNYNKFRAYATWPRTFFFKDGKRIIISDAVLENDTFVVKKIIPEGGKEQEYRS